MLKRSKNNFIIIETLTTEKLILYTFEICQNYHNFMFTNAF